MTVSIVHAARAQASGAEVVERVRREGIDTTAAPISRDLIDQLTTLRPDAVVIVCAGGAFDVVRLCRDITSAVDCGVIVLTPGGVPDPLSDHAFVIGVLDAGAVEILDIATQGPVLAAHLRVAMRARPSHVRDPLPVMVGELMIDEQAHVVSVAGEVVTIRPLQFRLLSTLARRAGSVVSRDELLREVWGVDPASVDPRRLRITVSGLRRILGTGPLRPVIESVARFGYRLTIPDVV